MPGYDFKSLSPHDFEELCHGLMEKELGIKLELFAQGRDSGIDLRHAFAASNALIVQCKHYATSGFSSLLSSIKNSESPKLPKLKPNRYVLATSVGLTPGNAIDLANAASPYCAGPGDVYGNERLNAILRDNPDIERAHFKLWLTSEPMLQLILHNSAFVQSTIDRHEIATKIKLFVQTAAVGKAMKILDNQHACIISGEPGIGKTTLAQILLATYLANNWQLVSARENIKEIMDVYRLSPDVKQVFYYDDFLGQIDLHDQMTKNEDKAIIQLLDFVRVHPAKRFILTTREYILREAQSQSEPFNRSDIDLKKYILALSDYTDEDKAKILANHLHFREVSSECIASVIRERNYMKIINHRNYNPRIIEYMTDKNRLSHGSPARYFEDFLDNLDHPDLVWKHAYDKKLHPNAQNVLLCLASCGPEVLLDDIKEAFRNFHLLRVHRYNFPASPSDFQDVLAVLEGSFVKINRYAAAATVAPLNPGIIDFLIDEVLRDEQNVVELLEGAIFFEQVERLFILINRSKNEKILAKAPQLQTYCLSAATRLIDSRSLRISIRTWVKPMQVSRTPVDHVARISTLLEILSPYDDLCSREVVLSTAERYFSEAAAQKPSPSGYAPLIEKLEALNWVARDRIDKWLSDIVPAFDEPIVDLEDAKILANFLAGRDGKYGDEIVEIANGQIYDFIESLRDDIKEKTTVEELEQLEADVDEIAAVSSIDVDWTKSKIASRIDELRSDERRREEYYYDEKYDIPQVRSIDTYHSTMPTQSRSNDLAAKVRAVPSSSKIDRIFDSLGD